MVFETVPMSFNTFAIDYLRGRAVLTDNIIGGSETPSVSLEFFIDPDHWRALRNIIWRVPGQEFHL